jgi:hypothetical protein
MKATTDGTSVILTPETDRDRAALEEMIRVGMGVIGMGRDANTMDVIHCEIAPRRGNNRSEKLADDFLADSTHPSGCSCGSPDCPQWKAAWLSN